MKKIAMLCVLFVFVTITCVSANPETPRVTLETDRGNITLELNRKAAPQTVDNFLKYVESGFYDGTVFHRVIKGFMIQGGGLTANMVKKETRPPVKNEADNGLSNRRGTIAMARTPDPHSATAQFFINTADNYSLNYKGKIKDGTEVSWGYCVFGKVVEGMAVVDAIEGSPTAMKSGRRDVPITTITIKKAVLSKEKAAPTTP